MKKQWIHHKLAALIAVFVWSAPALAQSELHIGSVYSGFSVSESERDSAGSALNSAGSTPAVGGLWFPIPQFSIESFTAAEMVDYTGTLVRDANLACETDVWAHRLAYHPLRSNLRDGTGMGVSVGITRIHTAFDADYKAVCEGNAYIGGTIFRERQFVSADWEKGVSNGLTVSLGFTSDIDDLLDDAGFTAALISVIPNSDFFIRVEAASFVAAERVIDNFGTGSSFGLSFGYLF